MSRKDKNMIEAFLALGAVAAVGTAVLYSKGKKAERPISFDEFLESASRFVDQYMISEKKKTGITYYGGECSVFRSEQDWQNVIVQIKIYGQDSAQQWKTSTLTHRRAINSFSNDEKTRKMLEQIQNNPIQLKVTSPEKEDNKK